MQTTSLYLRRFLKKLADNHFSSITKGSTYYRHIKHNVHTTFYHSSGLIRNWMFYGCIYTTRFYICWYCVFSWYGRINTPVNFAFERLKYSDNKVLGVNLRWVSPLLTSEVWLSSWIVSWIPLLLREISPSIVSSVSWLMFHSKIVAECRWMFVAIICFETWQS